MKTIKIIDLLNKIAKGEEVPKEIKIDEIEYKIVNPVYPHMYKDYSGNELEDNIHYITRFLDKEVEIIEEEKEIKKLKFSGDGQVDYTSVIPKINELIDAVNELNKDK